MLKVLAGGVLAFYAGLIAFVAWIVRDAIRHADQ